MLTGPLRATAGRMNEQSSGRSAALTQMPAAVAAAATSWSTSVPVAVTTRRTPSRSLGWNGAAGERVDVAGVDRRRHRRRDVGGDDAHDRPGLGEPGDLAGRDRTGADDEDGDAVEVERDRVGEPCGHGSRPYPTEISRFLIGLLGICARLGP